MSNEIHPVKTWLHEEVDLSRFLLGYPKKHPISLGLATLVALGSLAQPEGRFLTSLLLVAWVLAVPPICIGTWRSGARTASIALVFVSVAVLGAFSPQSSPTSGGVAGLRNEGRSRTPTDTSAIFSAPTARDPAAERLRAVQEALEESNKQAQRHYEDAMWEIRRNRRSYEEAEQARRQEAIAERHRREESDRAWRNQHEQDMQRIYPRR